jgi:hypothetical protein
MKAYVTYASGIFNLATRLRRYGSFTPRPLYPRTNWIAAALCQNQLLNNSSSRWSRFRTVLKNKACKDVDWIQLFQESTLWTWQETFEFCEIRKISWPGQLLPDSQDLNFMELEIYFLIITIVIVAIVILYIYIYIFPHTYENERGSNRSHSVKNSLRKRLWTCRKTTTE